MKTNPTETLIQELDEQSQITLIVGGRGQGKTATALFFAEKLHERNPDKKIFAVSHPGKLPAWIKKTNSIESVPEDSLILADESAVEFASRSSMTKKNKTLSTILPILRHKNQSAIFVTQNSSMSDLNLVRLVDCVIVKQPSLLQIETERSALKNILEAAQKELKNKDKTFAYVVNSNVKGLIQTALPTFWDEKTSKNRSNTKTTVTQEAPVTEIAKEKIPPKKVTSQIIILEAHKKIVAKNNWAKAFIIVGAIFTVTIIGALVGIPLLIIGLVLYYNNKNQEIKKYEEEINQEEQLQFQNRKPSQYEDNLAVQIWHNTPPEKKKGLKGLLMLIGIPTFYIMSPIWKKRFK